ncbi:hypothetical protein BKG83_08385 [Mycobacteroides chelonae]|jgi:hypothetical protein|uniref:hypothetical protein n=2 Tax=Mycobacteroides chelonae TaxID=1774 RepID=UPI0008A8E055|nr:hypothetical protein [Mycobacteroides chelonae]MBF9521135.1 hypothetical protein [Mycobacteroides chelonae]OHU54449.1 hypothetical protein BKG83_08385 [Mycobacteroides chelonae]PKQ56200.1 hypothetical protein B5566_20275 [Mycobacterium sp. MHSD3]SKM07998.1 Uncharacterised protein [Mycobacteroides abscessus subsp. bolletii]
MLISSRMLRTAVGVVMAAVLVVLVLPCAAMHRDVKAAATSLPHAVAAGSSQQLTDVAARRHDHIGQAQAFLCTVVGEVVIAMATPAAARLLWLVAAVIVVCALASVICTPVTRGPPPHTEAATTVSGRTLIHRLCVLRR